MQVEEVARTRDRAVVPTPTFLVLPLAAAAVGLGAAVVRPGETQVGISTRIRRARACWRRLSLRATNDHVGCQKKKAARATGKGLDTDMVVGRRKLPRGYLEHAVIVNGSR